MQAYLAVKPDFGVVTERGPAAELLQDGVDGLQQPLVWEVSE